MSSPSATQPPSPPHSNNGHPSTATNLKKEGFGRDPYTPPRSIMPDTLPDMSFDQYGDPSMYQTAAPLVYYSPQPVYMQSMPYYTPPSVTSHPAGAQSRNYRALATPSTASEAGRSRRSETPKRKRTPKTRSSKKGTPLLDQPLSALTRDYTIPIRDMEAWVKRPREERLKEVEKKKGYVSRPMNSFMLYRSAFAERVKKFCKENNHQVVSQVTGASWPLEPQHIREQYEKYANIERDNHQAAHPDYKFAPNKNSKKRNHDFDDDDSSDDDLDWEGTPRSNKRSRSNKREDTRSLSSTPFEADVVAHYPAPQYQPMPIHQSSYQYSNPYGPAPIMVGPEGMAGQYYQAGITPFGHNVDDVKYGRLEDSLPSYELTSPLVGMPDVGSHDLLSPVQQGVSQSPTGLEMLDPRLSQMDSNYQYQHFENVEHPQEVPRAYGHAEYMPTQQEVTHPGMATLTDVQAVWSGSGHAGLDFDRELQHWV